ncbi:MAG: 16S rRNA (adenine(1518)-N(6)/adenine(1519)-N(6))-dimethyltransferase RsmA [Acidimicrobiia bacterium]
MRSLLNEHGVQLTKALGQHFLADPNVARKIARLGECGSGSTVLEIGPGAGSLTEALVQTGAAVIALELDQRVIPVLEAVLRDIGAESQVQIVRGDVLQENLEALVGGRPASCISNVPYNVATPVLIRMLTDAPSIRDGVVMVQREVAERWCASPATAAYGGVTVKIALFASTRIVGHIPPSVFLPPPKVDSSLVRFVRHDPILYPNVSPKKLFSIIDAGFGQRRKTLGRALRSRFGDAAPELCVRAGIDPRARAETIPLEGWIALHDAVAEES